MKLYIILSRMMMNVFTDTNRGVSPIIYVALIIAVMLGIGGLALTIGSDITGSTAQQLEKSSFEIEDASTKEIKYTSSNTITSSDIDRLYALSDDGNKAIIFAENASGDGINLNGTIEQGDIVFNQYTAANASIEYGQEVTFIFEMDNGDTYQGGKVTLPPRSALGDRLGDGGNVNITNASFNATYNT